MTDPGVITLPGDPPVDPTAVMGRRALAWVLDLVLFLGVVAGLYALQAEYVPIPTGARDTACQQLEAAGGNQVASCAVLGDRAYVLSDTEVATQTLASLGWLVLFVVLQGATGGSPGKLLAGVRVVDEQGRRPGIGKSLGRTVLWAIDGAPWIVPVVGPIVALTSTGHRRVGDMAAGTYVVARAHAGQPVVFAGPAAPPAGSTPWGATPADWPEGPPTAEPETDERPVPATPHLDIRSLDVPAPTGRVDEGTPEVEPDPAWWADPTPSVEPPPADAPPGGIDGPPEAPTWEPPGAPDVRDPMDEWAPPTSPLPDQDDRAPERPNAPDEPATPEAVDATTADARRAVDERPPVEPAPFAPPGGAPAPQDIDARDPWGTGTTGSAGTGAGTAPRYELPPPQWDEARNTYLQWDPNRQAWLQWDAERERWKPIDT